MRANRTYGSEGGEGQLFPTPIIFSQVDRFRFKVKWIGRDHETCDGCGARSQRGGEASVPRAAQGRVSRRAAGMTIAGLRDE